MLSKPSRLYLDDPMICCPNKNPLTSIQSPRQQIHVCDLQPVPVQTCSLLFCTIFSMVPWTKFRSPLQKSIQTRLYIIFAVSLMANPERVQVLRALSSKQGLHHRSRPFQQLGAAQDFEPLEVGVSDFQCHQQRHMKC